MAFVPWEKLHPITVPHVPGCPIISVNSALAYAASDFCAKTHLWTYDVDAETTIPGEAVYDISVPEVLESVQWVTLDGSELESWQGKWVPPSKAAKLGKPVAFWKDGDTAIRFYPTPDAAYQFTCTVVLKPSKTALGIESFLFETHGETIASGALYRLMSIPNKEWTNFDLAAAHQARFERGIAKAKVWDNRNVPLRVAPRSF